MTRTPAAPSARPDHYARITAEIIQAIEEGVGQARMPWHHTGASIARPQNAVSGKRYRGVNVLALWIAANQASYDSGLWATYRQWRDVGGQVRKGEHATPILFWKRLGPAGDTDAGTDEDEANPRLVARSYAVFNRDQVDGYTTDPMPELDPAERLAKADAFFANLAIPARFDGHRAYYVPATDTIVMPPFARFHDVASFHGVALHEAAHASGAKHRLDRDLSGRFGSAAYAAEEAVAELTAAFVLADLGVAHHPRADHAAYIASWLQVLKDDPRAIFTAASKAQAAADWMHAQQPAA